MYAAVLADSLIRTRRHGYRQQVITARRAGVPRYYMQEARRMTAPLSHPLPRWSSDNAYGRNPIVTGLMLLVATAEIHDYARILRTI